MKDLIKKVEAKILSHQKKEGSWPINMAPSWFDQGDESDYESIMNALTEMVRLGYLKPYFSTICPFCDLRAGHADDPDKLIGEPIDCLSCPPEDMVYAEADDVVIRVNITDKLKDKLRAR